MTVSTQVSRNEYTGNGATTQYDFTFRILDKSHLLVQTLDTSESIVTLTLGTDYTVTGVNRYNGGKVVLTSALPTGYKISIERSTPVTQEASIRNQGGFFPEIHEDAFDKLTMLVQQAYGWWSGLSLRKPSWLANYYDAMNNRIRNLRDPSQAQDAATKNYVDLSNAANNDYTDSQLKHTLRFPDQVDQMQGADIRSHSLQGYNNQGKPVPVFAMTDTADLALKLASNDGQLLIGAPDNIDALRTIFPGDYARIETKGAFSAGDGGDGSWVYDHANLSVEVSLYPRIFIAPNYDPTGASGAWRPNIGKKLIKLAAIGFGIMGLNTAAGDTWPLQAAGAAQANKEILEQCAVWDGGKREKIIPPTVIYTSCYSFPTVNPNLKASFGTSTSNGPFFLTHEDLSTAPVFDIGTLSGRLSGLSLENIVVGSYKFFSVPNYNTFTDARDNRICFRIRHVGTRIKVSGLCAGGILQGYNLSEPWDGVQEECRALYCSNPKGTVPAYFIGSQETDNANAMEIRRLHIEFSPYAMEIGFCEHVNIVDSKIEAYREANAQHPLVKIQPQCSKINITGTQFVTNNASSYHAIEDLSQFTNFNHCWFAGADDANYPQAGIHWYKRINPTNSQTTFTNCHFNRCHAADGSDPNDYPIILGNYAVFDAVCRVSSTYNTSSGTVTVVNGGILNCGTGCTVKKLHLVTGSSTKAYGPTIWFTGTGNLVRRVTQTAGDNIFRLAGGDANNAIDSFGNQYLNTTASLIYTYGKRDVILTAATTVTQLFGFVGDIIRITSNSSGSTITNSANLITSSGANITMAAGVTYTFRMSSGSVARQVTA
ncbi:phage tail fiber protein [Klebsiella pneumoniae]|uniref:phage tail fiber domain-containing protein n=1 Tax=Klebsiella pneumoniae TaxID=573 RepID=UPI001D0E9F9C|nr:phage tail fiber protein [Klebsiella pneumoniae]MCS4348060.1 phage tail fiber protein [Klebsiella pneumoniae]